MKLENLFLLITLAFLLLKPVNLRSLSGVEKASVCSKIVHFLESHLLSGDFLE